MSTSYYILEDILCPHCKDPIDVKRTIIGCSSYGWKFLLALNGRQYYNNWLEMKLWLQGKEIVDEYSNLISCEDFILKVENKERIEKMKSFLDIKDVMIDDAGFEFYELEND